jgi:hypothetical protein
MFYIFIIFIISICVQLASSTNTTTVPSDYYSVPADEVNYDDDIWAKIITSRYNAKVRPIAQVGIQIKVLISLNVKNYKI